MSERPEHPVVDGPADAAGTMTTDPDGWGMVSTLLAGPLVWGLVGIGVDAVAGTGRMFLAVGLVVGFLTSFYIVFVRYGRS